MSEHEQTYSLTAEEIASAMAHALDNLADELPSNMATAEVNIRGEVTEFIERSEIVEWLEGATAKDDAIHLFHEALKNMDPDGE